MTVTDDSSAPRASIKSFQLKVAHLRFWLYVVAAYWPWFGAGALIAIFVQAIGRK